MDKVVLCPKCGVKRGKGTSRCWNEYCEDTTPLSECPIDEYGDIPAHEKRMLMRGRNDTMEEAKIRRIVNEEITAILTEYGMKRDRANRRRVIDDEIRGLNFP